LTKTCFLARITCNFKKIADPPNRKQADFTFCKGEEPFLIIYAQDAAFKTLPVLSFAKNAASPCKKRFLKREAMPSVPNAMQKTERLPDYASTAAHC